eukprot:3937202-Rhodomonas_salina.1
MTGFQCGYPSLAFELGLRPWAITFGKLTGGWFLCLTDAEDDTGFLMMSGLKRSRGPIFQMPDLMRITRQLGQVQKLAELVKDGRAFTVCTEKIQWQLMQCVQRNCEGEVTGHEKDATRAMRSFLSTCGGEKKRMQFWG